MLTHKEEQLYIFLTDFMARHHQAPVLTEIAAGLGVTSKGYIHRALAALETKGYIRRHKRHRGIELINAIPAGTLPLLGRIAAGKPIEAITDQLSFNFLDHLGGPNRYVLQVKGQSMEDEGILDGDWVIIERSEVARNHQIVAALIDGGEATLKRIHFLGKKTIRLIPANKAMAPVDYAAERVAIQGILVGQARTYR